MDARDLTSCWDFFKCKHTDCPAYGKKSDSCRCWIIASKYVDCPAAVGITDGMKHCWECPYFIAKHPEFDKITSYSLTNHHYPRYIAI